MSVRQEVPSPLLTPELVGLRRRLGACVAIDGLLLVWTAFRVLWPRCTAASLESAAALASLGLLFVLAMALWGGPRRYLELVPWYGWGHAGMAGVAGLLVLTRPAGGGGAWALLLGGAAVATLALARYPAAGAALWRERDVQTRRWGGWTFERLAAAPTGVLETIQRRGLGPLPRDLAGWSYRGLHLHPLARAFGVARFTLGFFAAAGVPDVEGFRRRTAQEGDGQPWQVDERVARYGWLVASPSDVRGRDRYPTATALDYGESRRNPSGDWLRLRISYLVMANSGDPGLLSGKVYVRLGRLHLPMGFVVLERLAEHGYEGPGE